MMNIRENELCNSLIDEYNPKIINDMLKFTESNKKFICVVGAGKRQFSDVLEAANNASCVEEFKLYISYKEAKAENRDIWKRLAKPLNIQVDELKSYAKSVVESGKKMEIELPIAEVHMKFVQRYMGYLMWQGNVLISELNEKKDQENSRRNRQNA